MVQTLSSEKAVTDQNPVNPVTYLERMDADIEVEIDGETYGEEALDEFEFEEVYPDEMEITEQGDGYKVETRYNHLDREEGYSPVDPEIPGVGAATVKGMLEPSNEEKQKQPVPADD